VFKMSAFSTHMRILTRESHWSMDASIALVNGVPNVYLHN